MAETSVIGTKAAPEPARRPVPGISDRAEAEAAARMVGQRKPAAPAEDLGRAA